MPKSNPKDKSKKITKDEVRTVRLEPPILEKLNEIAARDDRSVSYLLNKAVKEFVERAKK
jgi:predicted transcriptional regulator